MLTQSHNVSKLASWSDHVTLREPAQKKQQVRHSNITGVSGMLNVKVHEKVKVHHIRQRLNKYGLFGGVSKKKHRLSKKNKPTRL